MALGILPVELTVQSVKITDALVVGTKLLLIYRNDNAEFADKIRHDFKFIGTGICASKNKLIDIYQDETSGKIYGVSTIKLDRYFVIKKKG